MTNRTTTIKICGSLHDPTQINIGFVQHMHGCITTWGDKVNKHEVIHYVK